MHLCFLSKQNFSSARTFHFGLINFDVYSGFPVCRMYWDHRLECRRWRLASKEAEAPPLDDCTVLEIDKHGVELKGTLGPSTPSTAPSRRFASCKLKWPESSGKNSLLSALT